MADIGYISLLLALAAAIYTVIAFALGVRRGYPELLASARNGVFVVCGLVSLAAISLIYSLVSHDFQLEYVASYTSRDLPLVYTLSAFWAGNAGSLLFWAWLLSIFAVILVVQNRHKDRQFTSYAFMVMMVVLAFFIILVSFVSKPFDKLPTALADGMGLNPLLENPGMIFHPPALLFGYVAFTVPFALGVAALLSGKLGDDWVKGARRWTIVAWLMLGIGNIIGAWWAYVELGWGGYWAWDPVENAGLMPWLVGTAFLHSIIIQRRRGMLKVWNMVLIIVAFNLCLFGTFLTRSGVLSSVHAFAESALGDFLLAFIGVAFVGSIGLLVYRLKDLKSESQMDSVVSRESSFLLNNLILVGAAFAVFIGTIFPLLSEAVTGTKTTVGASFFDRVVGPIFIALVFLTGICVFLGWRRASTRNLIRNFVPSVSVALILCLILFVVGIREWYALTLFPLCVFVGLTHVFAWFRETRARRYIRKENPLKAFAGLVWANKPRYGGMIVHLAIVLIFMGVVGSSFYQVETQVAVKPGESMTIQDYTLTYDGLSYEETPSKLVVTASLSVYNGGERVAEVFPEKYYDVSHQQWVTEVAIHSTPVDDLYVILGTWDEESTTTFKVLVNPLVMWIWIGGGVLLAGGVLAFWPDRRKQ